MSTKDEAVPNGGQQRDETQETPYWSSALSSMGIWSVVKPGTQAGNHATEEVNTTKLGPTTDHLTTPLYGKSLRSYPEGCPWPEVCWFHAVDVPKRTTLPPLGAKSAAEAKAIPKPKKFSAFSTEDSRRLETRYQSLLEAEEELREMTNGMEAKPQHATGDTMTMDTCVPVNEDFLFDVSIRQREICPVYWLGPVYEVRRGTWFFQDGSNLRPCEENLAAQLEEGYLKVKAWIAPEKGSNRKRDIANAQPTGNPSLSVPGDSTEPAAEAIQAKLKSYRLFGTYMNNTVTYEDASAAWLVSDGVLSWVAKSVYERFAGGGHMSGVKLIRGYSDQGKAKEKDKADNKKSPADIEDKKQVTDTSFSKDVAVGDEICGVTEATRTGKTLLQRRLSTIIDNEDRRSVAGEKEAQKLNEEDMRHDYLSPTGESQNRDIEHLVLVTHGIGQRLSLRTQSVNFIHDVNILRKTLKGVYTDSPELRSMNRDEDDGPGNCRMQVLPVCWRHKVEFPRRKKRKAQPDETDVAEAYEEEENYPTLEDITIDGAAYARTLISDLALDVLLYQSSYRAEISQTVIEESNRIVDLFRRRNPAFKGKIHLVGHSLGSAILFDILCHENRQRRYDLKPNPLRFLPHRGPAPFEIKDTLDFDVEDFYCLGSPIGLFQMLTGRTIAARQPKRNSSRVSLPRAIDSESLDGTFTADLDSESSASRPDTQQLFNIFYPSDPISYRLEPLIAPSMAAIKPHNLPYTKKGLFGVVGSQGLTGIGTKVGQSVSGLFASLSTGISTNLLPASLRTTGEEAQIMMQESNTTGTSADLLLRGRNGQGQVTTTESDGVDNDEEALSAKPSSQIASLYSRFGLSRDRGEEASTGPAIGSEDHQTQKQRIAQRKVWALNRNGRVDFSIQEGALDFNPISTIASHIGYWGEADVSHFILSQVLSRTHKKPSV